METTEANRGSSAWISCPEPCRRKQLRLFCFPYAGGGTALYHSWLPDLPPGVELCRVHLPGRENRFGDPLFTRLAPLIDALTRALPAYFDVPFVFFGHSMGALISFELARQLQQQGSPGPAHLFVSAHRAPQIPDSDPPLHALPECAFIEALRRLNGTPEAVLQDRELMSLLMPVLRADFAACETYVYSAGDPLNCGISAFGGVDDHRLSRDHLAAWRDQTRWSFSLRLFPGDHFFLHTSRALLLRALCEGLERLLTGRAPGDC